MKTRSRAEMNMASRHQGFTLVEVVIVVLIIGILTAIAVPNYQKYVARARRTEAWKDMSQIAMLEESHFANHPIDGYTDNLADLPFPTDGKYYTYEVDVPDKQSYTITARVRKDQGHDAQWRYEKNRCGEQLTLNHLGQRDAPDADPKFKAQCIPQ